MRSQYVGGMCKVYVQMDQTLQICMALVQSGVKFQSSTGSATAAGSSGLDGP